METVFKNEISEVRIYPSPLNSPSLVSGWAPARLFLLLQKHVSAVRIETQTKQFVCSPATYKKNITQSRVIFFLYVAGARFERAYPGYEPGELPLLYPADINITIK